MPHIENYRHALQIAHYLKRYQEIVSQLQKAHMDITAMQNAELKYVKKLSDDPDKTLSNIEYFDKHLELEVDYGLIKRLESNFVQDLLFIQTEIISLNIQNDQLDDLMQRLYGEWKIAPSYIDVNLKPIMDELYEELHTIKREIPSKAFDNHQLKTIFTRY